MPKKLKVFYGLVNYGTQAGLLASGLREHGVDSISVVNFDPFKRQADIELKPVSKWWQKLYIYLYNYVIKIYCFFKYNTFHFYFGKTLLPNQLDLPFYRLFNKKVVIEYLGNDIRHYESLVRRYNLPEDHDYYKNMKEHDLKVRKRVHSENKYIDYLVSCLPTHVDFAREYDIEVKEVLPLALEIESIVYKPLEKKKQGETITILHAPTNRIFKGTMYIEQAIDQLKEEGYDIEFRLVENVTHEELFKEYELCDIFIDQISVGWYGTAALEAMAVGRPTCAFIDERYYQYIDYAKDIPVVNVTRDNITEQLRFLIVNQNELSNLGRKSRQFVEKYHDVKHVAQKLKTIYQEKVWGKE
jgi:glycosyltransferase involved in cell wall biosynthesis